MRGTVTKRGRGWRLKFDIDRGADGRRETRYITFVGTKRQAEEELTRQLAAVNAGINIEPDKVTLGQYLRAISTGGMTCSRQACKHTAISSRAWRRR